MIQTLNFVHCNLRSKIKVITLFSLVTLKWLVTLNGSLILKWIIYVLLEKFRIVIFQLILLSETISMGKHLFV